MREMTLPEVLSDPLIRQLMRADKVSIHAFTTLFEKRRRVLKSRLS